MVIECFLYSLDIKCILKNGEPFTVPVLVYAQSRNQAFRIAESLLESGKSGWNIKKVTGFQFKLSSSFLTLDNARLSDRNPVG